MRAHTPMWFMVQNIYYIYVFNIDIVEQPNEGDKEI